MPDGLTPLALPVLPEWVERPSREGAAFDRQRAVWVFGLIGLLHVMGAVLVDAAMRLPAELAVLFDEPGVEIVLLSPLAVASVPLPDARVEPLLATVSSAPVTPRAVVPVTPTPGLNPITPSVSAAPAPLVDAGAIDSMTLFDSDGSPRLSTSVIDAAAPAAVAPDFEAPQGAGLAPLRSPVPYRATRFEPYWVPQDESLGDEVVRRLTLEKEFKTPWGTRWRCTTLLLFGACSDVPPAPMKNRPQMPWETYDPPPGDLPTPDPL